MSNKKRVSLLQDQPTRRSWIDERIKPTTSECVAVMVDIFNYPTIVWYSRKFKDWNLEDKDIKGKL